MLILTKLKDKDIYKSLSFFYSFYFDNIKIIINFAILKIKLLWKLIN